MNAHCKLSIIHFTEAATLGEERILDEERLYLFLDRMLSRWRQADDLNLEAIAAATLGFQVKHVPLRGKQLVGTLAEYLVQNRPQLIVIGTHGYAGLDHLCQGSIAETLYRRTATSTLFISPHTRGFVSPVTGEVKLHRVLVPVDHSPVPEPAIHAAREVGRVLIGREPALKLVHIGSTRPRLVDVRSAQPSVIVRSGPDTVQGIMDATAELAPDMISMATAGHHGLLDALRGSTTERVLRAAPCPVLTTPAEA